jgi:hypothetical protein
MRIDVLHNNPLKSVGEQPWDIWRIFGHSGGLHSVPSSGRQDRVQHFLWRIGIKPRRTFFVAQNHRHAMMDRFHELVGGASRHRHRVIRPQPGKAKGLVVRKVNQRLALVRPLIKSIGGNQTPPHSERFSKRGFDSDGFSGGIEDAFGLVPRGKEAPFGQRQRAGLRHTSRRAPLPKS